MHILLENLLILMDSTILFFYVHRIRTNLINTLLVIIGALLSGFHIYDKLLEIFNCGASVPIMNFGHLLAKGASEGYNNNGITAIIFQLL